MLSPLLEFAALRDRTLADLHAHEARPQRMDSPAGPKYHMLHMSNPRNTLSQLGGRLRERRLAAGLSQVDAARAAGVGRSTLIHLEHGRKDARLSNILAVAEAIGASLGLDAGSSERSERFRLRAEEAVKRKRRHNEHLRLALDLALGKPAALGALREARSMVELWRRERTCSPHYIKEWSRILSGTPSRVARRIGDIDEQWLDAMLQNTPFSAALSIR